MKKQSKAIVFLSAICALSCLGACASNPSESGSSIGGTPNYEWAYSPTMGDPCDQDMVIDGVLDEGRWQHQQKLEHEEKGVKMTYTTIFTQKGLYIGATAQDTEIGYTDRLRYEENSCFWFSVKGSEIDTTKMKGTEVFNFYIDGETASSFNHARYQAKGKTDKPYNEDPTLLTAELFVTWDALNIELGEDGELPEFVWINPHYRYIGGMDRDTWLNPLLFFDNNDRQQCSGRFGEVGYINADQEGAKIGNAANGHSKSDGWNLTDLQDGIVRSDVDHSQAIFFKDVYSTSYVYTVNVKVLNETCNGKLGEVGVVDMIDEISFHSFFLYQDSLLRKDYSKYATLSLYGTGFGGWTWIDAGVTMPDYNEDGSVTFTVLKDGGYFYYIVGDTLLMSKYVDYLEGASCPGLFALDCVAEFTDFEARDLSANPDEVDEILAGYNVYRVQKPDVISGGSLEFSTSSVVSGGDVKMTLTPSGGFILTGLTVNGEDVYEDVASKIVKGEYTLENVTEKTEIIPTFTRIPETVRVVGKIYQKGTTTPVLGASATVWGSDPLLYYSNLTASNGTYNFYLPKAGTQTIGGREFTFDGNYNFKARAGGYLSVNDTFSITESGAITKDYEMSQPTYDEWNQNVVGEEGMYTPSGTHYYTSAYSYTSKNKSDTVVYSVKITAPLGLTGYRGQLPNVGVVISDGTVITDKKTNQNVSYTIDNELFAARIGLSNCGVVAHTYSIAANARRLDRPVSDRWNFSTLNDDAAFKSSTTERTLTVAIIDDIVYIYVDGTYICNVSLLNTSYFFGDYTFKAGGQYTLGVNTTNIDHNATPITFEVLTEAYGETAYNLIQGEAMFEYIRDMYKPVNSRNMTENNGVYTLTSKAMGLPWGNGGEAFYYTSEASNAVVYSVKATLTKPLVGYTNPSDGNSAGFVGYTNIGIFITDGNAYTGPKEGSPFGVSDRTSNYIHIGLSELGLVASSMGEMRRRLDTDPSIRWYLDQGGVNADCAFTDGILERTLTIALYQGVVYIYVDGVYATKYALNNSLYFATTHFEFNENTQLKFGVGTEFVDASVTPVSFEVLTQLTGNAALEEINSNGLYKYSIITPLTANVTKNADGSYTHSSGWLSAITAYSYAYTTTKFSDTVVYKIRVTTTAAALSCCNKCLWHSRVGIVFSNGDTMNADTYADRLGTSRPCQANWLSNGFVAFSTYPHNDDQRKWLNVGSGIDGADVYHNATATNHTQNGRFHALGSGAFTDKTLTAVLYKGTIYVYVDDVYATSFSLDNDLLDYTNVNGEKKEIKSTDKLIFGTSALLMDVAPTTAELQYLTDAEALAEIQSNALYSNIDTTVA